MITFWRTRPLHKRLLVAIAIPYTEEQFFYLCQRGDSDFIKSMKAELNCSTDEALWNAYKETAAFIKATINEMRNQGATIIDELTLNDLNMIKGMDIAIIIAHNNNTFNKIEMFDGLKHHDEFIESLPADYSGWLDLSCCNSENLLGPIRIHFKNPSAHIVGTSINTDLAFRMRLYTIVTKILCRRPGLFYPKVLRKAKKRLEKMPSDVFKSKSFDIHLGNESILHIPQRTDINHNVYSTVYAPAEISCKSHMLIQVYLHLFEEAEKANALAIKSQPHAEQRDFIPLQYQLNEGDRVDVSLSITGESLLLADKKSIVWRGSLTKCSFCYFVPNDLDIEDLCCTVTIGINGVLYGEMQFITKITKNPTNLSPDILPKQYKRIFISYAHEDEPQVKPFARAYKAENKDYFFDRDYLKAGDIFPQQIEEYINSADLFLLFWSKNAAKSSYVQKEREQALRLAFPQVQPMSKAQIRIYPMSIEPRAELPEDMKNKYHFETVN